MYESDIARFIRNLRQADPAIAAGQEKNRATWWDKPQDLQVRRELAESNVPQPPYVYFPLPEKPE